MKTQAGEEHGPGRQEDAFFPFKKICFIFDHEYMCLNECICTGVGVCRRRPEASDPLELEAQVGVCCLAKMLESNSGPLEEWCTPLTTVPSLHLSFLTTLLAKSFSYFSVRRMQELLSKYLSRTCTVLHKLTVNER